MKRRNHLYRSFGLLLVGGLLAYGLSELLVAVGPIAGYHVKGFNPLSDLLDTTVNPSSETLSIPLDESDNPVASETLPADSTTATGDSTSRSCLVTSGPKLVEITIRGYELWRALCHKRLRQEEQAPYEDTFDPYQPATPHCRSDLL